MEEPNVDEMVSELHRKLLPLVYTQGIGVEEIMKLFEQAVQKDRLDKGEIDSLIHRLGNVCSKYLEPYNGNWPDAHNSVWKGWRLLMSIGNLDLVPTENSGIPPIFFKARDTIIYKFIPLVTSKIKTGGNNAGILLNDLLTWISHHRNLLNINSHQKGIIIDLLKTYQNLVPIELSDTFGLAVLGAARVISEADALITGVPPDLAPQLAFQAISTLDAYLDRDKMVYREQIYAAMEAGEHELIELFRNTVKDAEKRIASIGPLPQRFYHYYGFLMITLFPVWLKKTQQKGR